jgi:GNAT superfamily N-acetyltransferase
VTAAIRLATSDDTADVLRLRLAFLADIRGVEPSSFEPGFVAVTRTYLADVERQGRIRSWLAETSAGSAVGVASVLRNDAPPLPEQHLAHEGYLVNLWVAPGARRQGVARALLQTAIDDAPGWGIRRLYLHATDDGRPLYEQTGFVPDARWMGLRLARPT